MAGLYFLLTLSISKISKKMISKGSVYESANMYIIFSCRIPRWSKGDEESLGSDLNDRQVKLFNIVACWLTLYWIKRTSNYIGY